MKRSTNRKILAIFFAMLMFVEMLPTSLVSALADSTVDSSSVQVQSNPELLPEGTNGITDGDTVSVKVEKIWVNTEISEIPGNVTIRLKASYGVPGLDLGTSTTIYEVIIPYSSYGTPEQDRIVGEVVAGIPLKDGNGYTLANIYYDSEDAGNSQFISTTVSYESGAVEGTVTVINTIKKDITVQKVWDGVNPGDYSEVVFELTYGDVTLTASASKVGSIWRNATFTNIPMADANGEPYIFTVREVSIDGNTSFADDFTTSITGNEHDGFICTNIKKQDTTETVTVRVTKNWVGGSGFASSEIQVKCIAHANCITRTQTLYKSSTTTSQSYDFTELPLYTEGLGTAHRYVVTETSHTGNYYAQPPYLAESTNNRQVWVVDNVYDSIDLDAEKHWVGDEGNEGYRVDVTLTLWRRDSQGNEEQVYVGGSPVYATIKKDEINSSGIGTNSISGMKRLDDYGEEYEYYVKEPDVPPGYTAITSGMTVTNIWIEDSNISFVVGVKQWDANGHTHVAYPEVKVYLEEWNGTAWVRLDGGPIVIPSSTSGTVIFQSIVSTYGALDRSKSYRLVEESSDGRWSYTGGQIIWIENTGIGYVVLTNKLLVDIDDPPVDPENEFEEIYIRKTWNFAGSSNISNMVSTYTIHVSSLIADGIIEKLSSTGAFSYDVNTGIITVTLTGDDSITLKVPKYTSAGVRVTYTVGEDPIEGFISTVQSWYNAYVFTNTQITNSVAVNKIWENIEIRGNYNLGTLTLELQRVFESNDSWSNPETVEIVTISSWNPVDGNTFTASKSFAQSYPTHGLNASGSIEKYKYRVVESSNLADAAYFSMQGEALVVDGSATLTNVYKTELVEREILVEKIWEGEHIPATEEYPAVKIVVTNGDGFEEIIVFNASTSPVQSKKISVPKYATDENGVFLYEYTYTVEETEIAGVSLGADKTITLTWENSDGTMEKRVYTHLKVEETQNTIFIVRNHAVDPDWVETMELYGKKVWDTVEGVKLPLSVTFLLYADGVQIRSVDLYAADGWQVKFENLPIYNATDSTKSISYTLKEIVPDGYTGSLEQAFAPTLGYDAFVGILRNTPSNLPTYTIEFVKAWDANNSISALYKDVTDSITLHLKVAHTTAYVYEVKLVKGTDGIWRTTTTLPALYIKGYDADNNNSPIYDTITYTIEEFEFAGHTLQGITVSGANIQWVSDNQFQIVNTEDLADKASVGTVTLTNELEEPKIKVWGGKLWDDAGFAEVYRPENLTVTLQRSTDGTNWAPVTGYANYLVNSAGATGSTWVWGGYEVDKYDKDTGLVYQYRWVEADANVPAGYECTKKTAAAYIGETWNGTTEANMLVNKIVLIDLSLSKVWNTGTVPGTGIDTAGLELGNGISLYPATTKLTLMRFSTTTQAEKVTGYISMDLSATVTTAANLPKYDKSGNEYKYYLVEDATGDWYSFDSSGDLTIVGTNTLRGQSIDIIKSWPAGVDKSLLPATITFTLEGYIGTTKVYTRVSGAITVSGAGDITYTFANLPKYVYVNGTQNEIKYVLTESTNAFTLTDGEDYTTVAVSIGQNKVYNEIKTTSITVKKNWSLDGTAITINGVGSELLPDSITFVLKRSTTGVGAADGVVVTGYETIEVKKAEGWEKLISGLPASDANNNTFYYWAEEITISPAYKGARSADGTTYTNALDTVILTVNKAWKDSLGTDMANADLPDSISVTVTGTVGTYSKTYPLTITKSGGWTNSITLPRYAYVEDSWQLITYTVSEPTIQGYTKSVPTITSSTTGSYSVTITNTLQPTELVVVKSWVIDGKVTGTVPQGYLWKPATISVRLYRYTGTDDIEANREYMGGYQTITLVQTGSIYSYTFTNLPQYKYTQAGAEKYTYAVVEQAIDGFKSPVYSWIGSSFYITNELEVGSIKVIKDWNDNGNANNTRPTSITLTLRGYAQGITDAVVMQTYTTTGSMIDFNHTFSNLPKYYYDGSTALPITYTIEESGANGYSLSTASTGVTVSGMVVSVGNITEIDNRTVDITNELIPAELSGEKDWAWEGNDSDGLVPDSITIQLWRKSAEEPAHEVPGGSKVVTSTDGWAWKFTGFPSTDTSGNPYTYWVVEEEPTGFTKIDADGMDVTNTLKTVSIKVEKAWADDDELSRPDKVSVTLVGAVMGTSYLKSYTAEIETSTGSYTFENLPLYAYVGEAGSRHAELITYTVSEDSVPKGYTVSYVGDGVVSPAAVGDYETTITNSMIPIKITVEKSWFGDEYMINEGFSPRPTEINVQLLRSVGGNEDADFTALDMTVTLSETNGWFHTFEDLASHDGNNNAYTYYIKEWVTGYGVVPGYTITMQTSAVTETEGETYTIEIDNTLELIEITAQKEWVDDDADGMDVRPESITFVLTREGDADFILEKTVTEAEGWAWTFANLAKFDTEGNEYTYIVGELDVPGYTSVRREEEGGFVFTNTLISLDVVVTKNWRNDTTATRPGEVTFTLTGTGTKNGVPGVVYYQSSITVTKPNPDFGTTWSGRFEGVPKYDEMGELIRYVVTEGSILGYDQVGYSFRPETDEAMKAASTYYATLTNEYGVTELYGEKTWVDDDNAYSTRPLYITVELWRNVGGQDDEQVLDANSAPITQNVFYNPITQKWSWSFTNLMKYELTSGTAYTYYVVETRVDGYGYASTAVEGGNLVNTLRTTSLSGQKQWESYGFEELLPDSIIVTLQRSTDVGQNWSNVTKNGQTVQQTVTAAENWAWLFEDLPADVNGQDILYSVIETPVQGFTTAYDGYNIYNEMDTVDIKVIKDWQDDEDEHGLRPDRITVTISSAQIPGWSDTLELNAGNDWQASFEKLPRYVTGTNTFITYTISEGTVYAYDVVVGTAEVHANAEDDEYSVTLENAIKLIDLRVIKDWDDEDDRYETRPDSLDITLYQNGAFYSRAKLEDDGTGNLTAEFTGLPKDDGNGVQYEYTLGEDVPKGYTLVSISVWTEVTGAERETYQATITNALKTTSVNGGKIWRDSNNRDLARLDSITITLQYNTSYFTDNWRDVPGVDPLEVFGPTWEWQFDGLPEVDENGEWYFYRVAEWAHLGYTSSYAGETWTSLVNVPVTIDLRVEKAWQDGDRTAYRPATLEIELTSSTGATYSAELSEATGWAAEFTGLAKYDKDENLITYTLSETVPIGYTLVDISDWTVVTDDEQETYQATITNALETIDINVLKEWQDDENEHDLRPEKIVVTVTSEQLPGWSDTLELNAGNNWQASFEGLPRYIAGTNTLMTYTISEGTVYAYDVVVGTAEVHANAEDDEYSVTLENAIKLIDLRVIKDWDDEENRYETRPSSLNVTLYRNSQVYESTTLRADADGTWTAEFTNLPKEDENGDAYTYTLNENVPNGYRLVDISDWAAVTGAERETYQATITNALKTTSEYGWKTWRDSENRDRARPDSIMITLQYRSLSTSWRDVPGVDPLEVFGPTWEWQFDGLPAEDANGNQYTYRVGEWTHAGYTSSLSGESWMRLTNDPVTIDLRVEKVWQDSDRTSYRPATLEVQLTSSTGMTYRAALSAATGWAAEFTGLAKYDKDENLITYTLSETVPAGYSLVGISGWTAVTDADRETYEATITNALATTSVTVTKRWVGATGTSVTVRLMDGTTQVASATITSPWTYTFDNLPKYRTDGVTEIVYTVTEDSLTNFTTSISYTTNTDGTRSVTITNSYTPPTPTPTPTVTVTPSPTPTATTTPVRTTTPTPEITPTPTPNIPTLPPTDQPVLRIITIEDLDIPLGAGINLNLGDAFD